MPGRMSLAGLYRAETVAGAPWRRIDDAGAGLFPHGRAVRAGRSPATSSWCSQQRANGKLPAAYVRSLSEAWAVQHTRSAAATASSEMQCEDHPPRGVSAAEVQGVGFRDSVLEEAAQQRPRRLGAQLRRPHLGGSAICRQSQVVAAA